MKYKLLISSNHKEEEVHKIARLQTFSAIMMDVFSHTVFQQSNAFFVFRNNNNER